MNKLFDLLFGCWHKNYTFPIKSNGLHYICCLDCGKEFDYDWNKMKVKGPRTIIDGSHFLRWQEDAERVLAAHERVTISLEDTKFLKAMRIKA